MKKLKTIKIRLLKNTSNDSITKIDFLLYYRHLDKANLLNILEHPQD